MNLESFTQDFRALGQSIRSHANTLGRVQPTMEEARSARDLEFQMKLLSSPPIGIFKRSIDWSYSCEDLLLNRFPELYIGLLERFPGKLEDMVGYTYMTSPMILGAAIDAGERISITLEEDEETELGKAHCGKYRVPAVFYPVFTLVSKADTCMKYEKLSEYVGEYIRNAIRCLHLLSSAGSSVNMRASDGTTILNCLFVDDRPQTIIREVTSALYELGAVPDLGNSRTGITTLHHVMDQFGRGYGYDLETLRVLLSCRHPLDLAAKSHSGMTPLDSCWLNPFLNPAAVDIFLERAKTEYGDRIGDVLFQPSESRPPILYMLARAEPPCFEEIADLLLSYGASVYKFLKPQGSASFLEWEYFDRKDCESRLDVSDQRICDVVIKNTHGIFSEHVVNYFRGKLAGDK